MKKHLWALVLIAGVALPAAEPSAQVWALPPMPASPPPLVVSSYRDSGFIPPAYPDRERREGIPGEVLVEVSIDETGRVTTWKVVRATTPGYAKAIERKLKGTPTFKGASAGTYSWSFVFCGASKPPNASDRPGTIWIASESFGVR